MIKSHYKYLNNIIVRFNYICLFLMACNLQHMPYADMALLHRSLDYML